MKNRIIKSISYFGIAGFVLVNIFLVVSLLGIQEAQASDPPPGADYQDMCRDGNRIVFGCDTTGGTSCTLHEC